MLTLDQFRSDSGFVVEFNWGFNLRIYDGKRTLLAQVKNVGSEDLVEKIMGITRGMAQRAITRKVGEIFFEMLTTPEIHNAMIFEPAKAANRLSQAEFEMLQKKETIQTMKEQIERGEKTKLKFTAGQLIKKDIKDQESLDQLAEIIWKERNSNDRSVVNTLGYLCKIFMKSKNPRYSSFFEKLGQEGKARRLRKYARKTVQRLDIGIVEQFEPTGDLVDIHNDSNIDKNPDV